MTGHWLLMTGRVLCGTALLLMAGCSQQSAPTEKRLTREDGSVPPPSAPVQRQVSALAPTCTSTCSLPPAFTSADERQLGEKLQGFAGEDDFLYGGGSSGLPARTTFALRPEPTQEQLDLCSVTPPPPDSCEQIRLALPQTPTLEQMQQCWDDVSAQMDQVTDACKNVFLYNRAVEMQRDFLPVLSTFPDSDLLSLLGEELETFGGGPSGDLMIYHFARNVATPLTWTTNSDLSKYVRESNQLTGEGKAFDKSVEALRQWVNSRGGCPDWTQLGPDTLNTEVVSPLTNYPPTGNIFGVGWKLQGPLGGTQALRVRLVAWNVDQATKTVSGTLRMVVGDDFGVGDHDVYSPGLLAFWILQHQRGYRPFNNLVEVDYPFSFQYTPETIPADLPAGSGELGARLRMKNDSNVRAAYCGGQGELSSSSALSQPTYKVLGTSMAEVGSFVEGNELIFSITVQDTVENQTYTYKTGPGSRNPDGKPHARIAKLTEDEYLISFEDRYIPTADATAIDYDDVMVLVKGKLEVETGCKCPMGDQLDIYYNWTSVDGRDLDTRTQLVGPTSTNEVGWARDSTAGSYLYWHGDNTGWSGNERVTVYLNNLRNDFPGSQEFRVRLKAFWYGENLAGYTRVTVSGCLNNENVYYQPQLTTDSVGSDHPGEAVGDLVIRLDDSSSPTGFTIDTSATALGNSSEAPYCQESTTP